MADRSRSDVEGDLAARAAFERWLEIISEASRHIPDTWKAEHPGVPWRSIRDLGNVLRHAYDGIDFGILWTIYEIHLDPLLAAVEQMTADVSRREKTRLDPLNLSQFSGIRGRLTPDADIAPFTWFRVGGRAELLFQPADADDLATFLARLDPEVPVTVIGVGSNLLVRDGGVPGVVIRLSAKGFGHALREGERIRAGTALPDKRLAAFARDEGLGGFAFYHGIPGTIGGALRMNAGANGTETRERLVEAHAVDRAGRRHVLSLADMGYTYRHSAAAEDLIFTEGVFAGPPAERAAIEAEMAAVDHHRETAQPIREKTGGSTFTNPPGHRAWELVDAAGCRGLRIGGAMVSEMHCNFLINVDGATGHDLERLGETVRARVLDTSGVRLEWEIRRIGRFAEGAGVEPFLGRG